MASDSCKVQLNIKNKDGDLLNFYAGTVAELTALVEEGQKSSVLGPAFFGSPGTTTKSRIKKSDPPVEPEEQEKDVDAGEAAAAAKETAKTASIPASLLTKAKKFGVKTDGLDKAELAKAVAAAQAKAAS